MAKGEVHVWRAPANREGRALREVLARYVGGDPSAIALGTGEHGKPELGDPRSTLRFNLSHSGDLALIAVAEGCEVGVDVERIRARRDIGRLAERALDPEAAAAVRAAAPADRLAAFHRAWTRREATAKCLGTGLGMPLPPSPVAVAELDVGPGYAAALAIASGKVPSLRLFSLDD